MDFVFVVSVFSTDFSNFRFSNGKFNYDSVILIVLKCLKNVYIGLLKRTYLEGKNNQLQDLEIVYQYLHDYV